jgi:hypothetical protein
MTEDHPKGDNPGGARSKRRRNVVASSPHRAEYERLLGVGWTSMSLERYALHRYGEDIPAVTFRLYRKKLGLVRPSAQYRAVVPESMVDVLGTRAELIALQKARIAVDWNHEQQMAKLFGTTRSEIQVLSGLLDAHKADLQDLGVFPKAGEKLTINGLPVSPDESPRARSLAEALGVEVADEAEVAKLLHLSLKAAESGNGHRSEGRGAFGA